MPAEDIRIVVLVVDDEPKVGEILKRLLADERTEVLHAKSGLHALQTLELMEVDVVVADQVMPGMDGLLLLATVRDRWPGTKRVLLSAYLGTDTVIESVNRGGVHKVLAKPFDHATVRETIEQLVNERLAERTQPPPA